MLCHITQELVALTPSNYLDKSVKNFDIEVSFSIGKNESNKM